MIYRKYLVILRFKKGILMESYETNLNRIKEDIKAGKMIGNTVTENQEIQSLHNELEDIKAQNRLLEKSGVKSNFVPYETLKK